MGKESYVSDVMLRFLEGNYPPEVVRDVQRWMLEEQFMDEKEAELKKFWDSIPAERDEETELALKEGIRRIGGIPRKKNVVKNWWMRVAAVVIPVLFVAAGYFYFSREKEVQLVELTVPAGERLEEKLADGTDVWVNAGSSIVFAEDFKGKERRVKLKGEACFEVKKDAEKPFVIETEFLTVKVLGTELNIKAYPEEEKSVVTLSRGSVDVMVPGGRSYLLKPNNRLTYYNRSGKVVPEEIDASEAFGWRSHQMVFEDAPAEEILHTVERQYNVTVRQGDVVFEKDRYSLRFSGQESLEEVFAVLVKLIGGFAPEVNPDAVNLYPVEDKAEEAEVTEEIEETEVTEVPQSLLQKELRIDTPELSYRELFEAIESQWELTVGYNVSRFDPSGVLVLPESSFTLENLNKKVFLPAGYLLERAGNHLIVKEVEKEEPLELYALKGVVKVAGYGSPVVGAEVRINNSPQVKSTDSLGCFAWGELEAGCYVLQVKAPGYRPNKLEVEVKPQMEPQFEVLLREELSFAEQNLPSASPVAFADPADRLVFGRQTDSPVSEYRRPLLAIKSNVFYLATTTLNAAVEFSLNDKWTVDVVLGYNPWEFQSNGKFKHFLVQPELRYWPRHVFYGHFFGLHIHASNYHIAGIGLSEYMIDHRYKGYFAGGGLSWGYHKSVGKRFALEATLGIGYMHMNYDLYPRAENKEKIKRETFNYFGPTRAGISIVYILKCE